MNPFKNITKKIAELIFAGELKTHSRRSEFHNMKSARHIGILFDADREIDNKTVNDFYNELKSQGYKVNAAGWYSSEDIPTKPLNTLGIIYFSNQDSNWKGVPQTHEISEFFKKKFDILFILTQSEALPVKYIAALSKAAFKVGAYTKDANDLDFMIELKEQATIKHLIRDSINYLSEIKKN